LSQRGSIRRVECLPGFVHLIEKCVLLRALEAGVDPADVRKVPAKLQMDLNAQSAIGGMNLKWLEISDIRRLHAFTPVATTAARPVKPVRTVDATN